MNVKCPECLGNLQVDDRQAGRSIQCPACFGRIEIPLAAIQNDSVDPPEVRSSEDPVHGTNRMSELDLPDDLELPLLFEVTELPSPICEVAPHHDPSPADQQSPTRQPTVGKTKVQVKKPSPATLPPARTAVADTSTRPPESTTQLNTSLWDRVLESFEDTGPLIVRVGEKSAQFIGHIGSRTWEMVKFYRTRRTALLLRSPAWDWCGLSSLNVSRELIIPKSELVADTWEVELPPCCAVCGQDTDNAPQHESRTVDDVEATVWILLGGIPLAIYAWWYYGPWWMAAVVLVVAGSGFGSRRSQPVELEFCRCDKHHGSVLYPELFLIGEGLLVRVGQRRVKKEFRRLHAGEATEFTPPDPPDE